MRLKNKVAVITGGASGIGKATAIRFVQEGSKVVIGDINESLLEEAVKELKEQGGEATGVVCNITNREQVAKLMNTAKDQYGSLDILLNNAAITQSQTTILELEEEEFDRVIEVNVKGMYICSQEAARIMVAQKSGVMIGTSSLAGTQAAQRCISYAIAKAGLIAMHNNLAKELGPYGIRSNCIVVGAIMTPLLCSSLPEEAVKATKNMSPLHMMGEPEDIAEGFVYLASDEARFVTGTTLEISGGGIIATEPL